MTDCPGRDELKHYLARDGALGTAEGDRIEGHVETCLACQRVLDALSADDVPSGTTMPDLAALGFRVYKLLGAGGFGEVWLAQDLNLPRVVAVKMVRPGADPEGRGHALDALRRDAGLLTQVDHPNIVRVHAWLNVRGQQFMVMQYVSGGSLADLLKREGPLDWRRAARYVADVGEGLVEVHARGIVHRDVKPGNVLWEPARDEAVLTDFGVALRLADPSDVAGSLPYMAPEAFDGVVSPALDVFSLAATLFHLTTGARPFAGPTITALRDQAVLGLPDPDPRCRVLSGPIERVIRSGLTADPARRPPLRAFVEALRGALNQGLADTLTMPRPGAAPAGPATLRLVVSRRAGPARFEPVATAQPPPGRQTRDMMRVPVPPDAVRLHTGDRVRVEAVADRDGYLTVFNIGPTGNLNPLYPDDASAPPRRVAAGESVRVLDVELAPPVGIERLCAVWSRAPLPSGPEALYGLSAGSPPVSPSYRATRDMKRVGGTLDRLDPDDWKAVALELDHQP